MTQQRQIANVLRKNFFAFALSGLLAGCAALAPVAHFPAEEHYSTDPLGHGVSAHAWQHIQAFGDELEGYATYSYVLVGRNALDEQAAIRFHALLDAVKNASVPFGEGVLFAEKHQTNLFILPVTYAQNVQPNYELSKTLLGAIGANTKLDTSRPGPYIVTVRLPIHTPLFSPEIEMLYVDLTDAHPKAMREITSAYKAKLDDGILGMEALESLRLQILNALLHLEDSVKVAKVAYAAVINNISHTQTPERK